VEGSRRRGIGIAVRLPRTVTEKFTYYDASVR
jgi:hypothetical protein